MRSAALRPVRRPVPRLAPRLACGILLTLALGACSVLPQPEVVNTYVLTPPSGAPDAPSAPDDRASGAVKVLPSLAVMRPTASPGLDSRRVAVVEEERRLSSYPGVRWAAATPDLWRDYLIDTLRADPRWAAVSSEEQRLLTDLELHSTLQAFQAETTAQGLQVRIRVDAQLVDRVGRRVVATQRVDATQASERNAAALASAFDRCAAQVATRVKAWMQNAASLPPTAAPTPQTKESAQ